MFETKNNELGIEQSHPSRMFILINCMDEGVDNTINKIKKMNAVAQIQKTDGSYDAIAVLEADTNDEIKNAVHQIRTIDTISHTVTLRSSLDSGVLG